MIFSLSKKTISRILSPAILGGNHLSVQQITLKDQASYLSKSSTCIADLLVCSCTQAGFSRFTPNVTIRIHPVRLGARFLSIPSVSARTSQITLAGRYPDPQNSKSECSDFPLKKSDCLVFLDTHIILVPCTFVNKVK